MKRYLLPLLATLLLATPAYGLNMLQAPFSYFTDSNGVPLNGCKIYTYSAGTSTPKSTYTTSAGTIANPNPTICDSAGRVSLWLNGSYKIVVKDSLDNTIYTTDNVASQSATGDMNRSTYDPSSINQQLVGVSAIQTLTNKTLTNPTITGSNYKVVSFTYDVSTATGSQSITGVGFTPIGVDFIAAFSSGGNTAAMSWGSSDGTTNTSWFNSTGAFAAGLSGTAAIVAIASGGNDARASVSAFTSDGATLGWTKTGTPTGTITVIAKFYRR